MTATGQSRFTVNRYSANRLLLVLLGLLTLVAVIVAVGQAIQPTKPTSYQVANGIRCPICPEPLSVNQVQNTTSDQIRQQIARFVQQGWSEKQIDDYFVTAYGPSILLTPNSGRLAVVAWGLPFVIFVVCLILAGLLALRWSRRRSSEVPGVDPPSNDHPDDWQNYQHVVERELALREDS